MALDGCGLVCQYVIFFFNAIFAVLGFALLGLGLWLRFSESTKLLFAINGSGTFAAGVILLIVLGTVMLLVVMVGEYGACSKKKRALQLFSVLLFILAVAEITVGVLAYTNREQVGVKVVEFYNSIYTLFNVTNDLGLGVTLLFIHELFHCCGVTGIAVLETVKETCPAPKGFLENIAMPTCPGVLSDFFVYNAPTVMGVFIGIGALLIIALVCTIILLKQIKKDHTAASARYRAAY
ncbi:CD81 antigen isoform X2 [Hippocampus zosterae]|uniref:CD81 antigen isoform X2 n=1 Tax=Hippocampus zosterae TaxID=109293 RepID=UPI00223E5B0C|nr:CD81 antigen isoform X2 [Hippocampus zosterae]